MSIAGELARSVRQFFWDDAPESSSTTHAGDAALFESGSTLIARIEDAIRLRRSVLVTGPRGSGKSYCARKATENAVTKGFIGGYHFLQGNREIPRDYLSEDMLVLRSHDNKPLPQMLDALAVRIPSMRAEDTASLRDRYKLEHFPGVVREDQRERWKDPYWTVLFLDEINRFGDGFLDSLLSLTEERTIVRGGVKLHVPIVVVATANPPGYDVTAKKLSPPLQARISRSYRVSQPSLPSLVYRILPDPMDEYSQRHRCRFHIPLPLRKRLVAASLCLWGNPSLQRKGIGFLTPATRSLLERAAEESKPLARLLDEFGALVSFGPDARSIGDWLGCAMGLAKRRGLEDSAGWKPVDAATAPQDRAPALAIIKELIALEKRAMAAREAIVRKAAELDRANTKLIDAAGTKGEQAANEDVKKLVDEHGTLEETAKLAAEAAHAKGIQAEREVWSVWQIPVAAQDLLECALEVLAHKVRENFNEGTDPTKVADKERLISAIVRLAFADPKLEMFEPRYEDAIKRLTGIPEADYANGVPSGKRATAEFVYELIDELASPEHQAFVDALATGKAIGDHTFVAQIDLLRRAARRAHKADLSGAQTELAKLAAPSIALTEREIVEGALKMMPSLAAWKDAITTTKLPPPPKVENATTPSPSRSGMIADWLLSLDILATASEMAPVAPDTRHWLSPMVFGTRRKKESEAGRPITDAVEQVVHERHQHFFASEARDATAKALVDAVVAQLSRELTPAAAARFSAIANVLAART